MFLIDLDGTIYRGKETIESGVNFVRRLQAKGLDYLFLTNNTTRTPEMVVNKLKGHGVVTDVNHIYTPCMATSSYILERKKTAKVYIIGQIGLFNELLSHPEISYDDQKPDFVVVGMDTDLTYHKIRTAVRHIRNGATFIGTNSDLNLPSGDELLPGNGSVCKMIEVASGVAPVYIGKPSNIIVDKVLQKFNREKSDCLIVGDNYLTDIAAGFNSGVDTLLTLTGVHSKADIAEKKQPSFVVNNLNEFEL